jgi:hypothetical protein
VVVRQQAASFWTALVMDSHLRFCALGPTPESALLDLRAQVEKYLRGRNRPPQRRADCERWLAAWEVTNAT